MTMNRTEFENSLSNPLIFWIGKSQEEVRILLGDETAGMVNYDQRNPHHAYDLFEHTLRTVSNLPETAPILLRTAAFFHDIGKPDTAREKNGNLVFYNHAKKSAEIAKPILKELGYTEMEVEAICFYISFHDEFISMNIPDEKTVHKRMRKIMRENEVFMHADPHMLWNNLLLLKEADTKAQAEQVICNGIMIDSNEHKLKKIEKIRAYIETYE